MYVAITVPFDLRKAPEAKGSPLPHQLTLDTSGLTAGGSQKSREAVVWFVWRSETGPFKAPGFLLRIIKPLNVLDSFTQEQSHLWSFA